MVDFSAIFAANGDKVCVLTEEERNFFQCRLEFAKMIPGRREELGMTVKDLSEESGISMETISAIECFQHPATDEEMSLLLLALDIEE